jgi:hypothetical protein
MEVAPSIPLQTETPVSGRSLPTSSSSNPPKPVDAAMVQQRKDDLLKYVQNFYRASWNWRHTTKHAKWDKWDRNYHSIYDPTAKARKEPWQTKMFIGITVQTVEVICSQIFKTMMAPKPPIQVAAGPAGDELQAKLIEETMDYELRKSQFDVNFYDALKECVRYGSGFMKFFWERVEDVRPRRIPVYETPDQAIQRATPDALMGQAPMPQPMMLGHTIQPTQVLLKNNLSAKYVHIRDIFPEPNTKDWKKVLHRDKITYGEIVSFIKSGAFFPEAKEKLEYCLESDRFDEDIRQSKNDRGYFEQNRDMSKFEKKHTVWELYADIPRKWIDFTMPEGDDADVLIPGRVMVASGQALLLSEQNNFADGECPVLKLGYIRTGETYDKGIIELIEDEQDEINELRNLRVDNVNLIMNKIIAIIETALVDPKDLVSKPGGVIRLKANVQDVGKAIMPIVMPDVTQSAYKETFEIERQVQERTGANRVTLGSSGVIKDTNQTLGGMEMLRQTFNERLAAYGMLIESSFLIRAAEKIYSLVYQKLGHQDLLPILGDHPTQIGELPAPPPPFPGLPPLPPIPHMVPRYMAFAFVPPEEINRSYTFKPMGIFSLENKTIKAAQVMDLMKVFAGNPGFDLIAAGKYVAVHLQGIDEAEKWFHAAGLMGMPGMPPGLPPQLPGAPMGAPPGPLPPHPLNPPPNRNAPGLKGGPNGDQPNFLPPNPLRRTPVT